jgi:GNAT superfamily N-acetyltransferase
MIRAKVRLSKEISVGMRTLLHPYTSLSDNIQLQILKTYADAFPGTCELKVDLLPTREVYAIFGGGKFAAIVIFTRNVLAYLVVCPTDRGKGTGGIAIHAALDRCRSQGYDSMVFECGLGLIGYYQRFHGCEIHPGKRYYYDGVPYARMGIRI